MPYVPTIHLRTCTILIILFLSSLFFILSLSVPALQINDEWITTNQLHQIILGHQPLINEGKYGTQITGNSVYFSYHKNILGYSLIFPLLSVLPLIFLTTMGDNFRFFLLFLWAIIPVFIVFLIHHTYPQYSKVRSIPVILPISIISFVLFLVNLKYYYPFPSSITDSPIESAAVILTSHLLFSATVVLVFLITRQVFSDDKRGIIGTVAVICCSSLLYWATSAKDHMLSIFLITLVLYLFAQYSEHKSYSLAAGGFFLSGILVWARPELGFTVFFAVLLFFLTPFVRKLLKYELDIKKCALLLCIPFFVIPGLTPFFMNNFFLTGNPLYPPFLDMGGSEGLTQSKEIVNNEVMGVSSTNAMEQEKKIQFNPGHILGVIFKYFAPNLQTQWSDPISILFFPDRGTIMGLFPLTPLFLLGIILLPMLLLSTQISLSSADKNLIFLCICVIVGIFLAYARNLNGLHTSEGVGPDVRYLAPIYVPGGIIGLIGLKYFYADLSNISLKVFIPSVFVISPIIVLLLLIVQPLGGGIMQFNIVLSIFSLTLGILLFLQILFLKDMRWYYRTAPLNLLLMISVPLAWQIILIFLFSLARFDGYSYWIPLTEQIFTNFITPVG